MTESETACNVAFYHAMVFILDTNNKNVSIFEEEKTFTDILIKNLLMVPVKKLYMCQ